MPPDETSEPIVDASIQVREHVADAKHVVEEAREVAGEQVAAAGDHAFTAMEAAERAASAVAIVPSLDQIHEAARDGASKGASEAINERLERIEHRLDALASGDVVRVRDSEKRDNPGGVVETVDDGQDVIADGTEEVLDAVEPPAPAKPVPKAKGRFYRI